MGLGLWRKIKEFGKKVFKWGKEKLFPVVKKVWQHVVKPIMQTNPKTAPIVPMLSPFLGSGGTSVQPAIQTGLDAVKNTISPFIKLKKNGTTATAPPEAPPPMDDYNDDLGI